MASRPSVSPSLTLTHRGHISWNTLTKIQYDTIEEFNVDSKAECDQLNLAHVVRKKI